MLDLRCADAEGESAEGAVGGRVGVAADDHHARLRDALLGPDHVNDALAGIVQPEQRDPELFTVGDQGLDLSFGERVANAQISMDGRDAVVDGGQAQVGPAYRAFCKAEAFEGLWGGDFVEQLQIHEEQVGLAHGRVDDVVVPDFLE
ncbi:hypothetical protein BMS3Bbin01_02738 [bacterium BMS3Bbin01]|nr:hypothetical protein BMS3Bbin01_02738 [bacterium BMS3Bbin01]